MVADCETNFVCVSDLLARRFPSVFEALGHILSEHGIGFGAVGGTKDIWIRDYAPVQVDRDGSFVLFRYFPDYLRHGYQHLITNAREIVSGLPGVRSCEFSEIVLDGGNVVRHLGRAIVTDKIYRENPGIGRAELRERLRALLRVETLIVVPREPFDPFEHADGMVGWLDERSALINDYSTASESFDRRLNQSVRRQQLDLFELPYDPQPGRRDGIPSAAGNWMNSLQIRDLLIVSVFGMKGTNGHSESSGMSTQGLRLKLSNAWNWPKRGARSAARRGRLNWPNSRNSRASGRRSGVLCWDTEIAPGGHSPQTQYPQCIYGHGRQCWLEMGWEDASLGELLDRWSSLPPHIVHAIMALERSSHT